MRLLSLFGTAVVLVGCGNDFGVSKQALCDGVLQENEEFVDSPFDADGDGYFDGANSDCRDAYAPANLDCDDKDAAVGGGAGLDGDGDGVDACGDCDDADGENLTVAGTDDDSDGFDVCDDCDDTRQTVNPGSVESTCNGLDDDCNADTPDEDDVDRDGDSACDDCDDGDPYVFHGAEEACDNGVDDNCDGDVDENCTIDYSGDWELDTNVRYSCAFGSVQLNFDLLEITDRNPDVRVYGEGTNAQPGNMDGTFVAANAIEAENSILGSCDEYYAVSGTFTTENTFEGTFTATYVGGGACADCSNQSWDIVGTRL